MAERPVRALRFNGFGLGFWHWPVLNILLEIRAKAGIRSSMRGSSSLITSSSEKKIYSNIEEYSIWEDKLGVIRMRVHRKAERER